MLSPLSLVEINTTGMMPELSQLSYSLSAAPCPSPSQAVRVDFDEQLPGRCDDVLDAWAYEEHPGHCGGVLDACYMNDLQWHIGFSAAQPTL